MKTAAAARHRTVDRTCIAKGSHGLIFSLSGKTLFAVVRGLDVYTLCEKSMRDSSAPKGHNTIAQGAQPWDPKGPGVLKP